MSEVEQFRDAIRSAGLEPPEVVEADGKLRRFPSNGKRGDDAGWYVLHGDGIAAGAFGDWRTGISETWRANIDRALTPAEEAAHRAKVETMRREREAEETRRNAEAATNAAAIWPAAQHAPGLSETEKHQGAWRAASQWRAYDTDARWRRASFAEWGRPGSGFDDSTLFARLFAALVENLSNAGRSLTRRM